MPNAVVQARMDVARVDRMLQEARDTLVVRVRQEAQGGSTIAQLARDAGVARSTIYHWLRSIR